MRGRLRLIGRPLGPISLKLTYLSVKSLMWILPPTPLVSSWLASVVVLPKSE